MPQYPVAYPVIPDHRAWIQSQLPDIAAEGEGLDFATELTRPLAVLDSRVAELYAGIVDLRDATDGTLDLLGDRVGEKRAGMTNAEYRRVIAGRRVARFGAITAPRVLAGWRALTDPLEARIETPGSSSIHLFARVTWTPTSAWLVRAARVVLDLCAADAEVNAVIYKSTSAIFGDPGTGFGIGTYAWDLPTMEPS